MKTIPWGVLELAPEAVLTSDAAEDKIRKAYGREVNAGNLEAFLGRGVAEGVIGETEAAGVRRAMSLTERVVAVDRRAGPVPGPASPGRTGSAIQGATG